MASGSVKRVSGGSGLNGDKFIDGTLEEVTTTVSYIRKNAFISYSTLKSIHAPSCTSIGYGAFRNCSSLTTVDIPNCTTISSYAFYYCETLSEASFPACTTIGSSAFASCSSLRFVYLLGSSVASLGSSNAFNYTPIQAASYLGSFGSIFVPTSLANAYKTATNWSAYAPRIVGV